MCIRDSHGVGDLFEAGDVGADHVVALIAVLGGRIVAGMIDAAHDALELGVKDVYKRQGWWIMILECGRLKRLSGAPAARRTAAMEAAIPTQMVETSGLM